MPNRCRQSVPPASYYPTSPTASRASQATRNSSLFPYSTVRPPTNYSSQSWLPPRDDAPPVPAQPQGRGVNRRSTPSARSSGYSSDDMGNQGETPLYARSDWDEDEDQARTAGSESAYSRSSFAGMTTAPLSTAIRHNTLGGIPEEDEYEDSVTSGRGEVRKNGDGRWASGEMMLSPEAMTPHSAASHAYAQDAMSPPITGQGPWAAGGNMVMSPATMTATPATTTARYGNEIMASPGLMTPYLDDPNQNRSPRIVQGYASRGDNGSARKSTLPSVLELEHLTQRSKGLQQGYSEDDPFKDPANGSSPNLMTPAAQQRLGRMSVAPRRYSHSSSHPGSRNKGKGPGSPEDKAGNILAKVPIKTATGLPKFCATWRPFIVAGLSLISALLLTISLQNNPGPVSRYLKVPARAFGISPKGVEGVGLGLNGWCPLTGGECEDYRRGDFASADAMYTIPGEPLLDALGDAVTALCVLSWLLAMYNLATAFLHFYLFFALSLPYTHLLDEAQILAPNGGKGKSRAQAEVDIRVRCERPPYEGYLWVWWAWWGHRKAPVGHVYAILVGALAAASFGIAFGFKRNVSTGINSEKIEYGAGAFIPLVVLVFALDPLIAAAQWCWDIGYQWKTLLQPPDPSPAAIMLPPQSKGMAHIRPESGDSFFVPQTTFADPDAGAFHGTTQSRAASLFAAQPGADLDEETRRWLTDYPNDLDLVPLIADLRAGKPNDDFLLSDVGLLYVAPASSEEQALLVPPKGDIRKEILEDAHLELDERETPAHHAAEAMLDILDETFWWEDMESDVAKFVEGCAGCKYDKGGVAGINGMKAGMTPVPFTGVTGWTEEMGEKMTGYTGVAGKGGGGAVGDSAMAAEMAFAMRRAEEEAEKDRL